MDLVVIVAVSALVVFAGMLRRPEPDKGWRDQAEGLRERLEREGLPRT